MVSFRGQKKKLGPLPDRSPLGVEFKISDEHPHPFHMRNSPPPPWAKPLAEFIAVGCGKIGEVTVSAGCICSDPSCSLLISW